MPKTKEEKSKKIEKTIKKEKIVKQTYYHAVGRRKNAIARVNLFVTDGDEIKVGTNIIKKGEMMVNGKPIEKYFSGDVFQKIYMEPFRITNTVGRFTVSSVIVGGGPSGQLGAFVHGVARALEIADKEKFRSILKKKDYLRRDPRAKERRKAGFAQKARARKQSPKR